VEGEILHTEQQPANAEARAQATEVLRQLHAQRDGHRPAGDDEQADSEALTERQSATDNAQSAHSKVADVAPIGKPLVEPPEYGDRINDTEKEAYWIPGAFPTIFQNETGDLHYCPLKTTDIQSWGPHIMRSPGWHAQDCLI